MISVKKSEREISVDINCSCRLVVPVCADLDRNGVANHEPAALPPYVLWLINGMWLAQGVPSEISVLSWITRLIWLIHVQAPQLGHPASKILWNSTDYCFATAFKVILINSSPLLLALSCTHSQGICQRKKTKHNKSLYYAKQQSWLIVSVATIRLIEL